MAAPQQKRTAIPFNRPFVAGNEYAYIQEAINNGHISGDGPFTKRCQSLLQEIVACERVLLTTSCTDALEMSALLLDIKPGDEVIVPSFTFVSTVNAFVLRGAIPRFIDIRPDTLNLDENQIEKLITPATKVIVPVHYAGIGCEMDTIMEIALQTGIAVVEDNAQGLLGRYKGKNLGTFGALAALSFHETKNISCGEGGALLINDSTYIDRAEILREKGTNRSRFFRGQVDKYSWVDVGSSFLPSDLLAAFLCAQLEAYQTIQSLRRDIWSFYQSHLANWCEANGVRLPIVPSNCEQPYHMFYLLMPSETLRDAFLAHLRESHVLGVFHYLPLHLSEMGRRAPSSHCPVTEDASSRLVRLPFYNDLTRQDQMRVVDVALQFRC